VGSAAELPFTLERLFPGDGIWLAEFNASPVSLLERLAVVAARVRGVHLALETAAIPGLRRVGEGSDAFLGRLPAHAQRLETAGREIIGFGSVGIDDCGPLAGRVVAGREQEEQRQESDALLHPGLP